MHMADALLSPAVGATMWAASAGLMAYSSKKVKEDLDERKIPLMGVVGAFVFAAQMINFTIPGTGSSGHLGGGMMLAILLGPYAGFLSIASVLTVQALFFADGGLLALGANIFNLGFFPCFIAYPLIYKKVVGERFSKGRILAGALIASVVALQMGAFGVVLETLFSGIAELPFIPFLFLMQPIHLVIGIVEGLVTAAVVVFVRRARPEILETAGGGRAAGHRSLRKVLAGLVAAALLTGGGLSWFASAYPDGLEWSLFRASGKEEFKAPEPGIRGALGRVQKKTAFLPDYGFKEPKRSGVDEGERWPAVDSGTSVSGLVGGALTLALSVLIGFILKKRRRRV